MSGLFSNLGELVEIPQDPSAGPAGQPCRGRPRLRIPVRNQIEFQELALDDMLPPEHQARVVWNAVCGLDLGPWLAGIKACEGEVGRNATDPRLLVALWIQATLNGVGAARELGRLCEEHVVYRWLCGGISVNYHLLSSFRSEHGERWEYLLTEIVAALLQQNLVTLDRVAQDGMKVRASAGKSSFRREPTLEECLAEARQQVQALEKLREQPQDAEASLSRREAAARQRAVKEREARVAEALETCRRRQAEREEKGTKSRRKVQPVRVSTTDPDARTMQFAHGGYAPAYNVQMTSDTASGVILGVTVTDAGTDFEQLEPMLGQLQDRYGQIPDEVLVDGGYASLDSIQAAAALGSTVYAPLKDAQKQLKAGKDPYAPKKGDSPAISAWRIRMGTHLGKELYKLRCQTAEWVNAMSRNRGLYQMPVRGRRKCQIIGVLYAIAHDVILGAKLAAARLAKENMAVVAGLGRESEG